MKMRKLLAILMALALVMSFSVGALAVGTIGDGNKTITVKNTVAATELKVYQILRYTVNTAPNSGYSGLDFTDSAYQDVFIRTINTHVGGTTSALAADASPQTIMLYITNNLNTSDFAKELAEELEKAATNVYVQTGNPDYCDHSDPNQIEFSGVEDGYYLIIDTTPNKIDGYRKYEAFAMLQPGDANGIEIYLKSDFQKNFYKKADAASYFVGDTVTYTITATIPAPTGQNAFSSYTLTDTMGDGLDPDTFEIYINRDSAPLDDAEVTNITGGPAGGVTVFTFEAPTYKVGDEIEIIYKATVTADSTHDNIVNKLSHDWDGDLEPLTPVEVETYGFELEKIDGDTDLPLAVVGFKVYDKVPTYDQNGDINNSAVAYKFSEVTQGTAGNYIYNKDGNEILYTNANGEIKAWGLKEGTYYLVETNPLGGYNTIAPEEFILNAGTLASSENIKDLGTIENTAGILIPNTGGIGTTLFTIFGGVIILGAFTLLIANRKRIFGK